jgi:hypothetical protein
MLVLFDKKFPGFHMTYENFDPSTGVRVCRTFFLSNMQKLYKHYNVTQDIETFNSKGYDECCYLFNLYYILITFYKQVEQRIILKKVDIKNLKVSLLEGLNEFIGKQYNRDENYKHYIKENDILIQHNEYHILDKANVNDTHKVAVLRIEVRNIYSVISEKKVGGLIYADSFLVSCDDIFNLTKDILPMKFFYTSHLHLSDNDYKPLQIVKGSSIEKYLDIDMKGLMFHRNSFNLPYLFPDSSEYGLDNNQLFVSMTGKLHIYQDYIIIADNSIGYIILNKDNIEEIQYKDENKYLLFLIRIKESDYAPLSDIIKGEYLIYIPVGTISTIKSSKYELLEFFRTNYSCFKSIDERKEGEYELAITTIMENENDHLNYMSNTFNLTNITDSMNDMIETEYLSLLKGTNLNLEDYRLLTSSFKVESKQNDRRKMILMAGSVMADIDTFSYSLREIGVSCNNPCVIIKPPLSLVNDETKLLIYYVNELKNEKNRNRVIILNLITEPNIVDFIFKLTELLPNCYNDYEILNICYCVNYKLIHNSRNKEIYNNLFSMNNEHIITHIFIDDSGLIDEKVEKYNKLISLMNFSASIWNRRSFIHSKKELANLFQNTTDYRKVLQFYSDFKMDLGIVNKHEVFIPLTYLVERNVFEVFFKNCFNTPLKFFRSNITFTREDKNELTGDNQSGNNITTINPAIKGNMTDEEFESELIANVMKLKLTSTEPIIERVTGYISFKEDVDKLKRHVYDIKANYKCLHLIDTNFDVDKSDLGLVIGGRNLIKNKIFLEEIVKLLSGELPRFKPHRERSTITQKEIETLNNINFSRELPSGWSVEVPIFIDRNEKRHNYHPSKIYNNIGIELFIQEYLNMCNTAVDEYNKRAESNLKRFEI